MLIACILFGALLLQFILRTGAAERMEQATQIVSSSVAASKAQQALAEKPDALVNINTADSETLCELPGIGAVKAQAIIDYRLNNGPFTSLEELMEVKGIGEAVYERLKAYIVLE